MLKNKYCKQRLTNKPENLNGVDRFLETHEFRITTENPPKIKNKKQKVKKPTQKETTCRPYQTL